jgi:hypothetical protein
MTNDNYSGPIKGSAVQTGENPSVMTHCVHVRCAHRVIQNTEPQPFTVGLRLVPSCTTWWRRLVSMRCRTSTMRMVSCVCPCWPPRHARPLQPYLPATIRIDTHRVFGGFVSFSSDWC